MVCDEIKGQAEVRCHHRWVTAQSNEFEKINATKKKHDGNQERGSVKHKHSKLVQKFNKQKNFNTHARSREKKKEKKESRKRVAK